MSLIVALIIMIFAMANHASLDTLIFIVMIGWLSMVVEAIWRRIDIFVKSFIEALTDIKGK